MVETLNILETFPSAFIAEHSAGAAARHDRGHPPRPGGPERNICRTSPLFGASTLDVAHARERAALITPGRAIPESHLGPRGTASVLGEHTTQVSVVDRDGNVVSLTQTLCRQYGSKVAPPGLGFVYNSCLEFLDFENPQSPIYLKPGGTFPTNMAPTIVRTPDRVIALGSAGSDRIPPSICEVITNVVDRNMDIRDAVVAPRTIWNSAHDPGRVCIEVARPIGAVGCETLRRMGFDTMYVLRIRRTRCRTPPFSVVSTPSRTIRATGVFTGVGDPRRDGFAAGPRVAAASD